MQSKKEKRIRRHAKIRAKIFGTKEVPRFYVSRSAKHIYAQLIDDEKSKVLLSASDKDVKKVKSNKSEKAREVGKLIAKIALNPQAGGKKIEKVVFDRGGLIFHGRIKAVADGAREGGLKF